MLCRSSKPRNALPSAASSRLATTVCAPTSSGSHISKPAISNEIVVTANSRSHSLN